MGLRPFRLCQAPYLGPDQAVLLLAPPWRGCHVYGLEPRLVPARGGATRQSPLGSATRVLAAGMAIPGLGRGVVPSESVGFPPKVRWRYSCLAPLRHVVLQISLLESMLRHATQMWYGKWASRIEQNDRDEEGVNQ